MEEEACSTGSIVVAVGVKGLITGIFKIGEGSFHQNAVCDAVKVSFILTMTLISITNENYLDIIWKIFHLQMLVIA